MAIVMATGTRLKCESLYCRCDVMQRSQLVAGQVSYGRGEGDGNRSHEKVHCLPVH